LLLFV